MMTTPTSQEVTQTPAVTPKNGANSQLPTEAVERLLDNLRRGKVVHDEFADRLRRQFLISGRTMEAWEKEFKVSTPSNLDPALCRTLLGEVMQLHERASFYKAHADAVAGALSKGIESQFNDRFTALTQEMKDAGGKLPASKTLETLAKSELAQAESAHTSAEISKNFWKEVQDHLAFCRKVLENATIAASVEAKLLAHDS